MMRPWIDKCQTATDKIRDNVSLIGKELANGDRYCLSVTGHSFGCGAAKISDFTSQKTRALNKHPLFGSSFFLHHVLVVDTFNKLSIPGINKDAIFSNSNDSVNLLPISSMDGSGKLDERT